MQRKIQLLDTAKAGENVCIVAEATDRIVGR
jgi:hypothetical protein